MQRLVRSRPGSRAARSAALTAVVALVPLRAWTEEAPRAEIASSTSTGDGAPGSPAEPASTQPTEVPGPASVAPELEDPWRQRLDQAPAENREQPCTPWSTSINCTGELEMLFDPWLVAPAPAQKLDVSEESQPSQAPARAPTVAPSSAGGPEPEKAPVIEPAPEAPCVHASSDSWVVDPGLPEAPFD